MHTNLMAKKIESCNVSFLYQSFKAKTLVSFPFLI